LQAVSIARQHHIRGNDLSTPAPAAGIGRVQSTPQPPAAQAGAAADADNQAAPPTSAAAEASTPHLLTPAQQAQRPPAAGAGGGGALSGFDKFLASLAQQTAAQHLQPHLQPAFREAYRSLDEQRRKAVRTAHCTLEMSTKQALIYSCPRLVTLSTSAAAFQRSSNEQASVQGSSARGALTEGAITAPVAGTVPWLPPQEKERADAELAASHKRFEDLTRGPRAQSLLARAAAALSLSADKPAAPSRCALCVCTSYSV
jgi:hypothetical protein